MRAGGGLWQRAGRAGPCVRWLSARPPQSPPGGQTTVRRATTFRGIGLHSGEPCAVTACPAPADYGIRFEHGDAPAIRATWSNVVDTTLSTVLAGPPPTRLGRWGQAAGLTLAKLGAPAAGRRLAGPTVATVEHLMAALSGAGVQNAAIRVSGGEVPILDGSARDFSAALSRPDAVVDIPHSRPARLVHVHRRVVVEAPGGRRVSLSPWDARRDAERLRRGDLLIRVEVGAAFCACIWHVRRAGPLPGQLASRDPALGLRRCECASIPPSPRLPLRCISSGCCHSAPGVRSTVAIPPLSPTRALCTRRWTIDQKSSRRLKWNAASWEPAQRPRAPSASVTRYQC
jgi:hypothetical protein